MKLSEIFGKLIKYHSKARLEVQFCENEIKNITTINLKAFRKMFVEIPVNYRQTASDSYLNKYLTIIHGPTILCKFIFRDLMVTEFEGGISNQSNQSLYIYHFSTVIGFSSEKYSGSTGHRNSWYQ